MDNQTTQAGVAIESTPLFADESPDPETDAQALQECVAVLERIMRDNLLCGVGNARLVGGQIERPLYGCAHRAIDHAKARLANDKVHFSEVSDSERGIK
jgi:hypothetical protein